MFERIKAVARSFRTQGVKATLIAEIFGGLFKGIEQHQLFDYRSYLEAGTRKCWALFKAVDVVAKVAIDTPFRLQKKGGDGTDVQHKELLRLLSVPNEHETFSEMIYKIAGCMMLTGNAFVLKDEVNFNGERPSQIFNLNPKRMRIVVDQDEGITGYLYRVEGIGTEIPFDVSEIMHFRLPHVNNDYWGLGVVEAGEDLFQSFLNRQAWEGKFWKNGASPSGVLVCEDQVANQNDWELAKARWQKEYGGVQNSGKVAWLTGKWKFEKLGLTNSEMQNIESSRWTIEQIFMQCGVPLSVAGIRDAANYATARVDDLRFRRYTVKPLLRFIAETFNSDLVEGFNPALEMVFEIAGLTDLDNVRENLVPLFDRGCMSINELREAAGLQPDPDNPLWAQHFINAGLVPLELSGVVDFGKTEEAARSINQRFLNDILSPARNGHEHSRA